MSKPSKGSSIDIPTNILKDLLTPSEIRMLKNRWKIINLLKEGLSIRRIAEQVQVGTDTVVRTIRMVEKNNLITSLAKKIQKKTKLTPWIFGKSNE